jgi:hypothetical protein
MSTLFVRYEVPTLRAFFPPEKRDRFVQLLGNSNGRRDALKTMHHVVNFDPKWSTSLDATSDVVELLRGKGAGPKAYVIGTSNDQRVLPLDEAVGCVEKESGILVCKPGRLAYYCGEGRKRRIVLERGNSDRDLQ